jgi:hypothetical protein
MKRIELKGDNPYDEADFLIKDEGEFDYLIANSAKARRWCIEHQADERRWIAHADKKMQTALTKLGFSFYLC